MARLLLYLYCQEPDCNFHDSTVVTRRWFVAKLNLQIEGTRHYDKTKDEESKGHITKVISVSL